MRKRNKTLTIICLILVLIIILLIGYILLMKTNYEKENETKNETETSEKAFDLKKAETLLEEFGFNRRKGCETVIQGEYNDTFKSMVVLEKVAEEHIFEEDCATLLGSANYVETPEALYKGSIGVCKKGSKVKTISYSDANQIYKKMYGEDMPIDHVSGITLNSQDYELYEFIENRDIFAKLEYYGVGGTCASQHIREIKEATQEENTVKITIYDFETGSYELDNGLYHFSTDKLTTNIECSNKEECINTIKTKYLQFLNEYEITFEIVDHQYIFKSVNKVVY